MGIVSITILIITIAIIIAWVIEMKTARIELYELHIRALNRADPKDFITMCYINKTVYKECLKWDQDGIVRAWGRYQACETNKILPIFREDDTKIHPRYR